MEVVFLEQSLEAMPSYAMVGGPWLANHPGLNFPFSGLSHLENAVWNIFKPFVSIYRA
jgi:hypothetical protein